MLEVIITKCECSPTEWEWRVCDASGLALMLGWQKSRTDAKYEGEKALFNLLASDGNIPLRKAALSGDTKAAAASAPAGYAGPSSFRSRLREARRSL
jgi:hypothetical protein